MVYCTMKISEMKESAEVFERNGLGDTWLEANHDIIYGPSLEETDEFSQADQDLLEKLGWHRNTECDCIAAHV